MPNPLVQKIRELHASFNRTLRVPPVPSSGDKINLRNLEDLRVDISDLDGLLVDERKPDVAGTAPQRIVVEERRTQKKLALTFWYYWDHDLGPGDHKDWEPVSLVYDGDELEEIYARVHDGLVRFHPIRGERPIVYFTPFGHTPAVRVVNRSKDVHFFRLNDRKDQIRERWLDLCYQRADSNGWKSIMPRKLPPIETEDGPTLDMANWKTWGKHSVYLRI